MPTFMHACGLRGPCFRQNSLLGAGFGVFSSRRPSYSVIVSVPVTIHVAMCSLQTRRGFVTLRPFAAGWYVPEYTGPHETEVMTPSFGVNGAFRPECNASTVNTSGTSCASHNNSRPRSHPGGAWPSAREYPPGRVLESPLRALPHRHSNLPPQQFLRAVNRTSCLPAASRLHFFPAGRPGHYEWPSGAGSSSGLPDLPSPPA